MDILNYCDGKNNIDQICHFTKLNKSKVLACLKLLKKIKNRELNFVENNLNNKNILITGGTGSFGQSMTTFLLKKYKLKKIIIFSRDEQKHFEMQKCFQKIYII